MRDSILPRPEDHCRVQILVSPLGQFPSKTLDRLLKRLEDRLGNVEVAASANTRRVIHTKFIRAIDAELGRFGEFQAFRKVFGLVCIGQRSNKGHLSSASSSPDLNSPENSPRSESSVGESHSNERIRRSSMNEFPISASTNDCNHAADSVGNNKSPADEKRMKPLLEEFNRLKHEISDQLVDSRCVLFGFQSSPNPAECLTFSCSDDLSIISDQLEAVVQELLRSVYFVLESRRLDTSFEKIDNPPCPLLPDEEKYRMGLENVKSKAYRKKCIGRLRKRVADYAMLTGLLDAALHSYQSAIDLLKATADLLWLAAAYEGWCCAALMIKYGHKTFTESAESANVNMAVIHRVKTVAGALNAAHQDSETINQYFGHQRHRSDEIGKLLSCNPPLSVLASPDVDTTEPKESSSSGDNSPPTDRHVETSVNAANNNNNSSNNNRRLFFGGGPAKQKAWRQLLKLDSSSSQKEAASSVAGHDVIPLPSAMSSASRSASAQNLSSNQSPVVPVPNALAINSNGPSKAISSPQSLQGISRTDVRDRFQLSLENYARFSFAIYAEYECVMRAVHLHIFGHHYIEVESFLREHTCRFLDDKFVIFNNAMKSTICLATAEVYKQIGFRRKLAFFLRLSVFFKLYGDNQREEDYKRVYPILNTSLIGYGIGWRPFRDNCCRLFSQPIDRIFMNSSGTATFSLQVKAVHEVCTVAVRAGLTEIAIRHFCFMLETFFNHLDKAGILSLVEELNKLTHRQGNRLHLLAQPLTLDSVPPVYLPSLQFTRIPALSSVLINPLPAQLAPRIIDASCRNLKIFIYSPFQDRIKKDEVYWVVNCACGISVHVQNPLPVELVVDNFTLLTEGCQFESIPVRLNLPSCYGSCIDPAQNEVKLLGVPRSVGQLKIIGYECQVLGCKNAVKFPLRQSAAGNSSQIPSAKPPKISGSKQHQPCTVRVLPQLPILRVETSLTRTPTLSDNPNDAIAEAHVFSGQSSDFTITLHNTSESIGIRDVTIKIQQPQVCGGPKLLRVMAENQESDIKTLDPSDFQLTNIGAGLKRNLQIRIFGIDPTTSAFSGKIEHKTGTANNLPEQKIFVRRSIASSSTTSLAKSTLTLDQQDNQSTSSGETNRQQHLAAEAMPLLEEAADEEAATGHDLIPYIGRLLSADFSFSYTADLANAGGEEYVRFAKLPLAITIVPALNVSEWHILAGDSPFTRYIVIDVANQTDQEAELTYGLDRRTLTVQPKEVCRVPLLCPCCDEIHSTAFQKVAQMASHLMQMQEIDRLRRTLEKHLAKYLEIGWTVPRLKLEGQVPLGSLLSTVSFLRQLLVPSITINMLVDGKSYMKDEDIPVKVGHLIPIQVVLYSTVKGPVSGRMSLLCFQELQNNVRCAGHSDAMVICGLQQIPFAIEESRRASNTSSDSDDFSAEFLVAFSYEGIHKLQPKLEEMSVGAAHSPTLSEEDMFLPTLSFNVISKL